MFNKKTVLYLVHREPNSYCIFCHRYVTVCQKFFIYFIYLPRVSITNIIFFIFGQKTISISWNYRSLGTLNFTTETSFLIKVITNTKNVNCEKRVESNQNYQKFHRLLLMRVLHRWIRDTLVFLAIFLGIFCDFKNGCLKFFYWIMRNRMNFIL